MRKKLITAVAGVALAGTFTINVGLLNQVTARQTDPIQLDSQQSGLLKLQLLKSGLLKLQLLKSPLFSGIPPLSRIVGGG